MVECPDCREDLIKQIDVVNGCCKAIGNKLDSKLSLRNFGIAAACLCAPILGYLISINIMVGQCAEKEKVQSFEKLMIQQVTEIKEAVKHQANIFDRYVKRTEERDTKQDVEIEKLKEKERSDTRP